MSAARWPRGVFVGHVNETDRDRLVTLDVSRQGARMTPAEARMVAEELILRADFQDRTPDTRLVDGVPRRIAVVTEGGTNGEG